MTALVHHEASTAAVLRRGLLVLTLLGIVGTALELAALRHWTTAIQRIPWAGLLALAVGLALVAVRPNRRRVLIARALAALVTLIAVVGMYEHAKGNHEAGPLDAVYGPTWDTRSTWSQWWAALTHSVGPSPVLAPAVLIQASICLWLATLRHPALLADPVASPA